MSISPAKKLVPAETRDSLTERLRTAGPTHELSATDFARIFFKNPLSGDECAKYIPRNARSLLRVIAAVKEKKAYEPFCELLNGICDKYASQKGVGERDCFQFVVHSEHPPCHHPRTYTDKVAWQKPDIVMVKKWLAIRFLADLLLWEKSASPSSKPAIAWPHIRSILEGKSERDANALFQAGIYLGSIMQASPDLTGCFGLCVAAEFFRVLWSDASGVYYTKEIKWSSPDKALRILVQYVHQAHNPSLDPSISLRSPDDTHDGRDFKDWAMKSYARLPVWLVADNKGKVYVVDSVISVGHAWSRKNWVVRATHTVGPDGDEPLPVPVVIKDSFQREERLPLSEGAILTHIHEHGPVPGIMEKLTDFVVVDGDEKQIENVRLPDDMDPCLRFPNRVKYRIILVGSVTGHMFTACSSVQDALMMLYDVLEMSIVLHREFGLLHRDLSIANILRQQASAFVGDADTASTARMTRRPVFIRQLLAYRDPQPELQNSPMCLLIDFDNAFQDGKPTGALRTATPAFVARAVSAGMITHGTATIPAMPQLAIESAKAAYLRIHGQETYDVRSTYHNNLVPLPSSEELSFSYRPRHEAECCYWIATWFLMLALPAGASPRDDDTTRMSQYYANFEGHCIGEWQDRRREVFELGQEMWTAVLHPELSSLAPFARRLSEVVCPEYGRSEPPDPYHLHEAMQRILLDEICRLKEAGTVLPLNMKRQRDPKLKAQAGLAASAPTVLAARAAETKASASGSDAQSTGKRGRTDSSHATSASTSALDNGKEKKRKAATAPSRTSDRQRIKRQRAASASGP